MRDQTDVRGDNERRRFLGVLASGTALVLTGCASGPRAGLGKTESELENHEEEVSPAEDLMREHGVLKRVLLVYGEVLRRVEANEDIPLQALLDSAGIIRSFIEDYHEKLEEDFLFPRFRKANRLVDLVEVLTEQHQAGRRLTDITIRLAAPQALKDPRDRRNLADSLRLFSRLYNPHAAREDTVLFPALHEIVNPNEYGALGEDFEKKEHKLFGDDGFEKMVDRVAAIEKGLGIYDLSQFTPRE